MNVDVFTRPRVRRPCTYCGVPLVFHQLLTGRWAPFREPVTIHARRYDAPLPPMREILTIDVLDRHDCQTMRERVGP